MARATTPAPSVAAAMVRRVATDGATTPERRSIPTIPTIFGSPESTRQRAAATTGVQPSAS